MQIGILLRFVFSCLVHLLARLPTLVLVVLQDIDDRRYPRFILDESKRKGVHADMARENEYIAVGDQAEIRKRRIPIMMYLKMQVGGNLDLNEGGDH